MTDLTKVNKMSSREIAELTGKQHTHVLRDIREAEAPYLEVFGAESKFGLSDYTDSTNRRLPEYLLTKSQTLYLVSGYSPTIRAKIQMRWEELEQKPKVWTLEESLIYNLKLIEEKKALESKIEADSSKVVFADSVMGSGNSILVREFAKVLTDDGFKIGQNRLFDWLRENGYLNKKNEPYQSAMELGLFEVIERTIGAADQTFTTTTTKVTGKGQVYFAKKLKGDE